MVSAVLTEAARVATTPECPVPLVTQDLGVDADGDLWAVLDIGGVAVCEYDLDVGTAGCMLPALGDCLLFEVSIDGTRFACAERGSEDDLLRVSVFDAATGAAVAELEIPDSGAWAFADDDTIVRIGHDLETEEYPV